MYEADAEIMGWNANEQHCCVVSLAERSVNGGLVWCAVWTGMSVNHAILFSDKYFTCRIVVCKFFVPDFLRRLSSLSDNVRECVYLIILRMAAIGFSLSGEDILTFLSKVESFRQRERILHLDQFNLMGLKLNDTLKRSIKSFHWTPS